MPTKFTVFDKETAKEIKNLLKNNKRNFVQKVKEIDDNPNNKINKTQAKAAPEVLDNKVKKSRRLNKEEKAKRKANRTPAQQKAINERMAKLRELRNKRKAEKK